MLGITSRQAALGCCLEKGKPGRRIIESMSLLVIGTCSSSLATILRIKAETREKQGDMMGSGIIIPTQTRSSVFLSCLSGLRRGEANTSSYFSNPSFCRKSSNSFIPHYTIPQRFVSECFSPCRQSVAVHRLERNYANRRSRFFLNSY